MKTIKFNNKQYQVPENWSEVTLGQQIQVSEISHGEKYVKTLGIIAGYTKIPVDELKHAKIQDVNAIMESLTFLQDDISEEPITEFQFRGETYYVHQNLLEQEFQDFVSIQTAIAEAGDKRWQASPYILAVMAKRQGETLDDYDIRARAKAFQELDVVTANRVAAFFLSSSKVLKSISMLSSPAIQQEALRNKWRELKDSVKQLKKQHGGNLLIRLWTTILLRWTTYLEKQWEKSCSSPASKPSRKKWKTIYNRLQSMMRKNKNKN
jgi:hypothetical protein